VVRGRCTTVYGHLVLLLPWATVVERGARAEGLAVLGVSSAGASPSRGCARDADVRTNAGAFLRNTRACATPAEFFPSIKTRRLWEAAMAGDTMTTDQAGHLTKRHTPAPAVVAPIRASKDKGHDVLDGKGGRHGKEA
jgi:hypothetical protein